MLTASTALLTNRELEVATLLAEGLSHKAIARELGVSSNCVNVHLTNIRRKLPDEGRRSLVIARFIWEVQASC